MRNKLQVLENVRAERDEREQHEKYEEIKSLLAQQEQAIYTEIEALIPHYGAAHLETIKNYYLKKRYLLRIQENLSKFASR
mgnify:CR=1 FL=1